jgi:DNA-binding transcriptional LysR family regulator
MIELRELRHLLAVVDRRHFGRAARAVGLSQPALTKSIQRLEKQLGAKLLDRSRRNVTPTPIGQTVIERARSLIGRAAELHREVDLLQGLEIGTLDLGVGPAMAETFVTDAIARLAEQHHGARITVRVDHWRELSEALYDGRLDLFVADASEPHKDQRLRVVSVPRKRFVWICRNGHPLASARRVTRKDLLSYPLATPKIPDWARRWLVEGAGPDFQHDPSHPLNTLQCESYALLKRVVLASNCISAALHASVADELRDGTLVALPIKAPELHTHAGIVHLSHRTLSPLAKAFVKGVLEAAKAAEGG